LWGVQVSSTVYGQQKVPITLITRKRHYKGLGLSVCSCMGFNGLMIKFAEIQPNKFPREFSTFSPPLLEGIKILMAPLNKIRFKIVNFLKKKKIRLGP
jgi:hypothetical protein